MRGVKHRIDIPLPYLDISRKTIPYTICTNGIRIDGYNSREGTTTSQNMNFFPHWVVC